MIENKCREMKRPIKWSESCWNHVTLSTQVLVSKFIFIYESMHHAYPLAKPPQNPNFLLICNSHLNQDSKIKGYMDKWDVWQHIKSIKSIKTIKTIKTINQINQKYQNYQNYPPPSNYQINQIQINQNYQITTWPICLLWVQPLRLSRVNHQTIF